MRYYFTESSKLLFSVITKRKRDEDETAGVAEEDILPVNTRGPRLLTSNDHRKRLAREFETCCLEVGTLRTNVARSGSQREQQLRMVILNSNIWSLINN